MVDSATIDLLTMIAVAVETLVRQSGGGAQRVAVEHRLTTGTSTENSAIRRSSSTRATGTATPARG
jgi:hypothetical protein